MRRLTRSCLLIALTGIFAGAAGACVLREEFFEFDDDPVAAGGRGGAGSGTGSGGAGQSSSGTGIQCKQAPCGVPGECAEAVDCAPTDACKTLIGCVNNTCSYDFAPNGTVTSTDGCVEMQCSGGQVVEMSNIARYTGCGDGGECDGDGACKLAQGESCTVMVEGVATDDNTLCAGNICEDGICRRGLGGGCVVDQDCGLLYDCFMNYSKTKGTCKLHPGNACKESDDCIHNFCGDGSCVKCDASVPEKMCPAGYFCQDTIYTCQSTSGCADDDNCGSGKTCLVNICVANCEEDNDNYKSKPCADGELCVNDFCVREDALIDPVN